MIKHRSKIWALFLLVCIIAQLVTSVVGSAVISSVQQAIVEYETKQAEMQATEPTQTENESEESDDSKILGNIIAVISNVTQYLGIIIVVYGVFGFVLAFKNEDAEANSRSIKMIVIGGALVGSKFIIQTILGL